MKGKQIILLNIKNIIIPTFWESKVNWVKLSITIQFIFKTKNTPWNFLSSNFVQCSVMLDKIITRIHSLVMFQPSTKKIFWNLYHKLTIDLLKLRDTNVYPQYSITNRQSILWIHDLRSTTIYYIKINLFLVSTD